MHNYNSKELLALDIAKALNDPDSYAQFLSFAHRIPEDALRKLLARALSLKGIRNPAGLFVSLVKGYEKTRHM